MKRNLLILLSILFIATSINAQSPITGFLGVNLNDKPSVAIGKLKQRFPNVEWIYPSIHISDITFIGTNFKELVISYRDEKLTEAKFSYVTSTAAVDSPFISQSEFQNDIQIQQNKLISDVSQIFNSLGTTICSKYGNPVSSTNGNAVWRDTNFNSIILNATIESKRGSFGIMFIGNIKIIYTTSVSNNNEF